MTGHDPKRIFPSTAGRSNFKARTGLLPSTAVLYKGAVVMVTKMRRTLLALIALGTFLNPARAETSLKEGAYDVEVMLELPHVVDTNTRKIERLCLGKNQSITLGLVVLSNNNPLGKCPAFNAKSSKSTISFDVVCVGVNAAAGHAQYEIMPEQFRGRIEMKMGGKNMTMTEVQVGHRIGTCEMLKTH